MRAAWRRDCESQAVKLLEPGTEIDGFLIALEAKTGRIVWVTQMQNWEDPKEKDSRVMWTAPVLASDRLILGSSDGKLVSLSPYTGDMLGWEEAPAGISIAPVVANGTLYFLTDDADLVAYR